MTPAATAATGAIFLLTYIFVAVGRVPGLRLDRAGAALVGGSLMLAVGAVTLDDLGKAVDLPTLALLLGLMIVVGNLRLSGFFRLVTAWVVAHARHPLQLLAAVILSAGVFSAFLLNDAICLVMTPLVVDIARRLRRDPVPYLLAVAMASNIGSTATITGNPQNILIGSFSGIAYGRFAAVLSPVAAVGLVLTFALIWLRHPEEFRRRGDGFAHPRPAHLHRPLTLKALAITLAMVGAFFAGLPPALVALVAGGALLLTRIVRSERIYREIDWPLLLMFAGLFVVVAGFEKVLLTPETVAVVGRLHLDQVPVLSLVTAALSNLVSNVPAVLVLRPFLGTAGEPDRAWLTVAMASTLAGNLTILGSVANLIVVQGARAHGVAIGFWAYFRVGAPLTVLTIVIGACWLSPMIFFSESGLIEPSRRPEWEEWYKGHLAAMASVPGVLSAQRFAALDPGVPPSLAMYTVTSPAIFTSETYLNVRGMGPWVGLVDETLHRRNLFEGLETAPEIPEGGVLAVADRGAPEPIDGLTWLSAAGLDRTTPVRGIGVFPDVASARRVTARNAVIYRPMTSRYAGTPEPRRNNFGQPVGWAIEPTWKPAQKPPLTAMEGRFAIVEPLDAERHGADVFVANAKGDGSNFTYYPYGPFATLDQQKEWIAGVCADPNRLFHAIRDKATGKAVGVACYANITPANGVIEIAALNFSPLLQRKPAATEAHYLLMRRVFDELGYRRYEWKCDSWNLPSRAAAARLGFTYEGLFRQAIVVRGRNRDTMYFAIVDKDWPRLKAAFEHWLDPANFAADGSQRRSLASFR